MTWSVAWALPQRPFSGFRRRRLLAGLGMRGRRGRGDDGATKLAEGQEVQPVLMALRSRRVRREPHDVTDSELAGRVYRLARCAGSRVDPDDWFPVARGVAKA